MARLASIILKSIMIFMLVMTAAALPVSESLAQRGGGGRSGSRASGPGDGGGGDPDVEHFLNLAKRLSAYFHTLPMTDRPSFSIDEFTAIVRRIDDSVKDEAAPDLIEFPSRLLRNREGREKPALFNRRDTSIRVNRRYWSRANDRDRLILITMELTGHLRGALRYETARALIVGRLAGILAMGIPNDGLRAPISMRIATQDADIFARLTENDVIIDGGILGRGDELNQRAVRFLDDPTEDREWMARIEQAWANDRPAFFLLKNESGEIASFSYIAKGYYRDNSGRSLMLHTMNLKSGEAFQRSDCRSNMGTAPVLDFVRNCLLDSRYFNGIDHIWSARLTGNADQDQAAWRTVMSRFKSNLIYHFSKDIRVMELAIKDLLIRDYSGLMTEISKFELVLLSLQGSGMQPTLMGEGQESPFWKRTEQINPSAKRFVTALELLARERLGLLTLGDECTEGDQRIRSARLVPLGQLRAMVVSRACRRAPVGTRDCQPDSQLERNLYVAMSAAGYKYDYSAMRWFNTQARTLPQSLARGGSFHSNPLALRLMSEKLSMSEIHELLETTLSSMSVEQRLSVYGDLYLDLPSLGLSSEEAASVFRTAVVDLISLKAEDIPNTGIGWSYQTLVSFVARSIQLAISNQLLSPSYSREFISRISAPTAFSNVVAVQLLTAHFYSSSRELTYPHFRFSVDRAFALAPQQAAESLVRLQQMPYHQRMIQVRSPQFVFPYRDLLWALEKAFEAGIERTIEAELAGQLRQRFTLGAALEAQLERLGSNRTSDEEVRMLMQQLTLPQYQSHSRVFALDWLLSRPDLSLGARDLIVSVLIEMARRSVAGQAASSSGLQASNHLDQVFSVMELPFRVELSPATQERVFEFALSFTRQGALHRTTEVTLTDALVFAGDRGWRIHNLQRWLDRLTMIEPRTDAVLTQVQNRTGMPVGFYTTQRAIIQGLSSCRSSTTTTDAFGETRQRFACRDLQSPRALLEKVLQVRGLPRELIDQARAELAASPR